MSRTLGSNRQHHSKMRSRLGSACGAVLAAAALGLTAAPAATAAEVCHSGYVCAYNGFFDGPMRAFGAEYDNRYVTFDRLKATIYNNYTNRAVWSANTSGWSCLNPGGYLWWGSLAIYIGTSGSRC